MNRDFNVRIFFVCLFNDFNRPHLSFSEQWENTFAEVCLPVTAYQVIELLCFSLKAHFKLDLEM